MIPTKIKLYTESNLSELTSFARLPKPWNLYAKHLASIFPGLKLLKNFLRIPSQNMVVDFVAFRKPDELLFVWYSPHLQWYSLSKLLPIFLKIEEKFKEITNDIPFLKDKEAYLKPVFLLMTGGIDASLLSCLKYFQGLSLEVLQFKREKNKLETLQLFATREMPGTSRRREFEMVTLTEEERTDFMALDEICEETLLAEAEEWK